MLPKILIVEDDKFLRNAYQNILKRENLEVRLAINGKEGVEIADEWGPNLVLLDLLMPEMDGIGFLKAFDAKNKPDTKIIVFSNLALPAKIDEAISLGAVNFKTKAMYTPKEMISLIRKTLAEGPVTNAKTATPAADPLVEDAAQSATTKTSD
jgi:DNA-binding NtrC family response regulator